MMDDTAALGAFAALAQDTRLRIVRLLVTAGPQGLSAGAVGEALDPNRHQAMMEVPSADAEPGTVVQEIQSGYMIKDRLLRPAMVAVAKKGD